jgi:hypothetical protein
MFWVLGSIKKNYMHMCGVTGSQYVSLASYPNILIKLSSNVIFLRWKVVRMPIEKWFAMASQNAMQLVTYKKNICLGISAI